MFSPGYQESLDYVVSTLRAAGYNPQVNQFNFPVWEESQPPVLNRVSPSPKTYVPGDADDNDQPTADFITMANSPTVELTNAPVFPVGGIVDPPTGGSASGCQDADYGGVSGKVALVQRGTCPFVQKWSLAQAAGATGVIIYNEGNTPARQNPLFVDNQPDPPATIAAVISSYALGNELLQAYKQNLNPTVDFKVYGVFTNRFLPQVIAETRDGDPNHVVVVGAHLDSVPELLARLRTPRHLAEGERCLVEDEDRGQPEPGQGHRPTSARTRLARRPRLGARAARAGGRDDRGDRA